MQLERYAADEVPKVVRAPDYLRVICRWGATHCDGPTMGMLARGVSLAFFGRQNDGCVAIYNRSVDTKALETTVRERRREMRLRMCVTLARMRSVDMAVGSCRPLRSDG